MKHKNFFISALLSFISVASYALALPVCPSDQDVIWHNCRGTYTWDDGQSYVGGWKDDEMHGQGTNTFPDGDKYVGEYKDGKRHGHGIYTWSDGESYDGDYQDNEMHGQGTYTYPNGDKYVGGHKNDNSHGQGTYTYANGDKYVGGWKDNEKYGQGVYTDANDHVSTTVDGILRPPEGLFKVIANKLYYDTENTLGVDEIDFNHADNLFEILKSNNQIHTLILNSGGGLFVAASEMADLVIDAELDTHVDKNCLSACVTIFLAGNNRSLALGGKIGFHKGHWEASNLKSYYTNNKEDEEWADPFEFASWLYEDTQSDIFKAFEYLLERGVKASFAIKTLKADSDGMWKPRRSELILGGILTQ